MPSPNDTINSYFDAIRRMDADAWVSCFAADSVAYDPAHGSARRGLKAHRAFFEGVAAQFVELDFRAGETFICGNRAAVSFSAHCRAGNGRQAEVRGIDVFQFDDDGKIMQLDGYWNPAPLFEAARA